MRRVFELERANRMDALWKKQGIHERITAREEKIEKARVEKHAARVETTNAPLPVTTAPPNGPSPKTVTGEG